MQCGIELLQEQPWEEAFPRGGGGGGGGGRGGGGGGGAGGGTLVDC